MSAALTLTAGILDLGFVVFHLLFWKLFGWPDRLQASGRTNAAITQTLNIMLTLAFALYGAKLVHSGWRGEQGDAQLLAAGVLFGLVRSALQPLMFGLAQPASKAFLAVALAATGVHAAAMF